MERSKKRPDQQRYVPAGRRQAATSQSTAVSEDDSNKTSHNKASTSTSPGERVTSGKPMGRGRARPIPQLYVPPPKRTSHQPVPKDQTSGNCGDHRDLYYDCLPPTKTKLQVNQSVKESSESNAQAPCKVQDVDIAMPPDPSNSSCDSSFDVDNSVPDAATPLEQNNKMCESNSEPPSSEADKSSHVVASSTIAVESNMLADMGTEYKVVDGCVVDDLTSESTPLHSMDTSNEAYGDESMLVSDNSIPDIGQQPMSRDQPVVNGDSEEFMKESSVSHGEVATEAVVQTTADSDMKSVATDDEQGDKLNSPTQCDNATATSETENQTGSSETENQTGSNETENQTGSNETENQTGSNETENQADSNETENQTGSNETENQTGNNATENQTGSNETENQTGSNEAEEETASNKTEEQTASKQNQDDMSSSKTHDDSIAADTTTDQTPSKVKLSKKQLKRAQKEAKKKAPKAASKKKTSDVAPSPSIKSAVMPKSAVAADGDVEEDSWDCIYGEDGECLDDEVMEELKEKIGEVDIHKPVIDYLEFTPRGPDLDEASVSHLVEIYDFNESLKTADLVNIFTSSLTKEFDIKWVDDTHAIGVFASSVAAQDALTYVHPLVKTRPLSQASRQTKQKVKHCTEFLLPKKARPDTNVATARRLVAATLGLSTKVTQEQRKKEKEQLKHAKEKKRDDRNTKESVWEGTVADSATANDTFRLEASPTTTEKASSSKKKWNGTLGKCAMDDV